MRKTLFAGLTQLDPADPLALDNYSFQAINPDIIDRLLEVGAVTHRHDNHDALADPLSAPYCASGTGGQVPGGVTFEFAYTLLDDDRGETLESPLCSVTTPDLMAAPTSAPVGSADYAAGSLSGDAYYYAATWVDAGGGETTLGAIEAVDVDPAVNAQVLLSGLTAAMPAEAVAWRLYRARGGEGFHYLASGSTDTIADDGTLCANCQVFPPTVNTTTQSCSLSIGPPALPAGAASWRLYGRAAAADWPINSYLASGTDATPLTVLTTFAPTYGRPPSRSLALRGAHQIDPDTELLDWHWKRPVAEWAALPSGSLGDVRLVEDPGELWAVLASGGAVDQDDWTLLSTGGGGGGSIRQVAASGDGSAFDPEAVIFQSSGGIGISVSSLGGSALVLIGDTVYTGIGVTDEDGPQLSGMDALRFRASGGAHVGVSNLGGGSADVLIAADRYEGIGVTDADGPQLSGMDALVFLASGAATVGVSDLGGGSAQIMVNASGTPGIQGPAGTAGAAGTPGDGTIFRVSASGVGPAVVSPTRHLEFGGSAGTKVGVEDLGGGSARVVVGSPPMLTSLPSNPHPGQEVNYQASGGASGAVWHLRYNPDAFSAHKWEFMGGGPLYAQIAADETFSTNANYQDPTTPGPRVTLPLAGDYEYHFSADVFISAISANGPFNLGLSFDGANPVVPDLAVVQETTAVSGAQEGHRSGVIGNQPANRVVSLKYQVSVSTGGTPHTRWRSLMLRPIRVSGP